MSDKSIVPVEAPKKPSRGRGGKNNFPANRQGFGESESDKMLVRRLMGEVLQSYRKERVKSDEELAQRLDEFFRECAEQGKIPTVEEMAMCTGYTYNAFYKIMAGLNPGFSSETKNIIQRAREFLKTFDAKLVLTGEINPIVYFFRAKNYYGMRDQQEVVVQANDNKAPEMSNADIAEWYLEDGKTVETSFTDEQNDQR